MAYRSCSHFRSAAPSRQRGAVLLVGLILLLVLTMVGVSTMQSTTLESKMVANMGDREVCFEAAERAAKRAESWIDGRGTAPASSDSGGGANPVYQHLSNGWWDTASNWTAMMNDTMTAGAQESQAPMYVVEELADDITLNDDLNSQEGGKTNSSVSVYRITAKGYGQRSTNNCIIETTFAKKFH